MISNIFNSYVHALKNDSLAKLLETAIPFEASLFMIPGVGAVASAFGWAMAHDAPNSTRSLKERFALAALPPALAIGGAVVGVAALSSLMPVFAAAAVGIVVGGPAILGATALTAYGVGYVIPRQILKAVDKTFGKKP